MTSLKIAISATLYFFAAQSLGKIPVKCVVPAAHLPPFVYGESTELQTPKPGLTVEGLQYVFHQIPDIDLKIERLPYNRMATSLKQGEYDCTVSIDIESVSSSGMLTRPHRPPLSKDGKIDSQRRFSRSTLVVYYNAKKPIIWDGNKLTPDIPVYSSIKEFNPAATTKGIKIISENLDLKRQIQQLAMGRIDAIFSLESLADPIIKIYANGEIRKNKIPISVTDNFIVFSHQFYKKHPDICERIWNRGVGFRNEAEFKKIEQKYLEK